MRQPNILRPIKLTTTIPEDLRAQLDLYLYSSLEGRIPKGAYQDFICSRIREFFSSTTLDLATIRPVIFPPGKSIIRGSAETISILSDSMEL